MLITGYLYTSNDSGVTWTEQTAAGYGIWYYIVSSGDGNKIVAIDSNYGNKYNL